MLRNAQMSNSIFQNGSNKISHIPKSYCQPNSFYQKYLFEVGYPLNFQVII